jgi:pyruvate dehydrogenase E2 component (dihydrolipoamide acetyltransferase)
MPEFYNMPQASPTMEKGTLLKWVKAEGDALAPQDVIGEVATDKAAMEIEVFDPGVMLKHLVEEGAIVPAGYPIAIIGTDAAEDISALLAEFETIKAQADSAPTPASAPAAAASPAVSSAPAAPAKIGYTPVLWMGQELPSGIIEGPGVFTMAHTQPAVSGPTVRATALARRIAAAKGIDLQHVGGSGPQGRVRKADVLAAARPAVPAIQMRPGDDTVVPNSPMRSTIATRLKASWLDSPAFYLTAALDCDAFVALRTQLKTDNPDKKVSYNDLLLKCIAAALVDVPEVNASWSESAITHHGNVDIGVAVALPDGLITPVIRDADDKSVFDIATEVRDLAGKAKAMKLSPEQYTGATFTVSNLGMMGIEQFTAILNPPAGAILAVGTLKQEPVVIDGALAVGWRMRVTMTCDHRVIDGALGARFLTALRQYVESPDTLELS